MTLLQELKIFIKNIAPWLYSLIVFSLFFSIFGLHKVTIYSRDLILPVFSDNSFSVQVFKMIERDFVPPGVQLIVTNPWSGFIAQLEIVIILAFICLSEFLAKHYFRSPEATWLLIIWAGYIFLSLLCNLVNSILQGFQETKWYSIEEVVRLGVTVLTFFPLYHLGLGIYAPALAFVIGVTTSLLVQLFGLYKYRFILAYPLHDFKEASKELFKFSIPVIFTGISNKIITYSDVLMLTYFVSLSEVGTYNVVMPTAMFMLFFGGAVSTILYPMSAKMWAAKQHERLSAAIRLIYSYSFLTQIPIFFTIFAFADIFIKYLFGDPYLSGVLAFQILLVGMFVYTITTNNQTLLSAVGKPIIVTKNVSIAAAINIVLNIFAIPYYGILGAAITTMISNLFMFVFSTYEVRKIVQVSSPWNNWGKILLCGFTFAVVLLHIKNNPLLANFWMNLVAAFLFGTAIYLFLAYLFGLINFQEIKKIISLARR